MTAVDAHAVQCPECGAVDSVAMSDGTHLCLGCRTEWDPRTVPILPPPGASDPASDFTLSPSLQRIFAADSAEGVLRAVGDGFDGTDAGSLPSPSNGLDWTGEFVRYERMGVDCLVIEDKGGQMLELQDADGTTYKCKRSSCVRINPFGRNDAAIADTLDATAADDQPMAQTILAVAGLTLTVALDAIEAAGGDDVGNPRIGWLPPPCNELPEVEQGVAYAAGFLISTWGLDRAEVRKLAANLMTGASIDAPEGNTE